MRAMKEAGKPQLDIQEALQELKKRKKLLETKVLAKLISYSRRD